MHNITELHFDSRDSINKSDFKVKIAQFRKVNKVLVSNVEIPYSFYVFTSLNNVLSITQSTITEEIVIPEGNYSAQDLATLITDLLNASFSNFSFDFNVNTLKYTITNSTTPFVINSSSTIASHLGFINLPNILSLTETGTNVVNLSKGNYLFIKSNSLTSGMNWSPLSNGLYSSILVKVPINASSGGVISYMPTMPHRYDYTGSKNIDNIDFQLVDANGVLVDLNGLDWAISLIIETN